MNGYTRAQVIGFLTLVIIFLIILFVGIKLVSYLNKDEPKEVLQNVDVKKEDFTLRLNGDFLIYLGEMEDYKELGAKAYDDGKNISDRIAISYFKDGRQVSKIDTESSGYYTVKYEASNGEKLKEAKRIIIVHDDKKPRLVMPDAVSISVNEVFGYDVYEGIVATDNSGKVSLRCENNLKDELGNYVIKCIAIDENGNENVKKRLVKVISGIEFVNKGNLIINYPSGDNYTYMYSLDNGVHFKEASISESLDVSGNVIALVLENGKYKMSSTYYKK